MPVIIQYLLKLSLSIAVIHAFYYLVLRRLTFYNLNRWYLAGYTVLCFVIPFINVAQIADRVDEKLPVLTYIPSVQNIRSYIPSGIGQTAQYSWTIWDGIIVLLAVGSAILVIKMIMQIISFIRLKQKAEVLSDNGATIYHIDEQVMPFSFGNSIYLNKNSHTDKELEEIIMHEYVHVKQMHSVDILIAELFCVINWYNPFAWFMRHSIRQNLEFIADDNVVRSGINKKDYQYHLLKVVGTPQYRIANQFNFSSLKKRIIMMNQQRSAKVHLLKFMFILPLLAVTLLAFRSEIAKAVTKISAIPANNSKAKQTVGNGQINVIKTQKPTDKTVDVQAYFTGEVLKAKKNKGTYFLVIKHGDRYDAYTNLSAINVKEGDKITKGQVIGAVALDKTTGLPTIKFSMFNSLANIDAREIL
jgi:beta-lactamase regulating signal transducer with metallopeptidase domain